MTHSARLFLAGVAWLASGPSLVAQYQPPAASGVPRALPPSIVASPETELPIAPRMTIIPPPGVAPVQLQSLGQERFIAFSPQSMSIKRIGGSWQLWQNSAVFKDFGNNSDDANDVFRTIRELYPTQWGQIGSGRVVVEYALDEGKPAPVAGFPRTVLPLDAKTLRVEMVRGVWCLRDDTNLHLNFGSSRPDAELSLAVCRKYGFTHVGTVGRTGPVMTYFIFQPDAPAPRLGSTPIQRLVQEEQLSRTGIEIGGGNFVGEKIRIDPRKVELRKVRSEWTIASGTETLAKFGPSEWAARDALRVVQDLRATEFCRFGTAGVSFFLVNGLAPRNVPFFTKGSRFEPENLKIRELAGKFWLYDATGRSVLPAGSQEEAEQLISILKTYGFDQVCRVGTSSVATMTFLAKSQ